MYPGKKRYKELEELVEGMPLWKGRVGRLTKEPEISVETLEGMPLCFVNFRAISRSVWWSLGAPPCAPPLQHPKETALLSLRWNYFPIKQLLFDGASTTALVVV